MERYRIKRRTIDKLISYENISKLSLCLFICVLYSFYEIRIYVELTYIILMCFYFISRGKKFTIYTAWNLLFVGICLVSNLWSIDTNASYLGARAAIEIAIIGNLLIAFIDNEEKVIFLYRCFVIAGFILVMKCIVVVPINMWGTARIGNAIYNPNAIGLHLAISAICAVQLVNIRKKNIYYLVVCIFFVTILLTGSRKSFLFFLIGVPLLYTVNLNKISKKMLIIPIIFLFVLAAYKIVLNVPEFYGILGKRLEGLFNLLLGQGKVDNSTKTRINMINIGMSLFKNKPFLGYGISSYASLSGYNMYAHNNYIELLVGVGLIGTFIYYSIYAYIIFQLTKIRKKILGNNLLIIIVVLAIIEYGLVSYYGEVYQILIASSIAVIKQLKHDRDKTSNYNIPKIGDIDNA